MARLRYYKQEFLTFDTSLPYAVGYKNYFGTPQRMTLTWRRYWKKHPNWMLVKRIERSKQ